MYLLIFKVKWYGDVNISYLLIFEKKIKLIISGTFKILYRPF